MIVRRSAKNAEGPFSALGLNAHIVAKVADRPHPVTRHRVKFAHLVIGVGQNDPCRIRLGLPVAVPTVDKLAARLFAGLGSVDHAMILIGRQRADRAAVGEVARRLTLPVVMLAANQSASVSSVVEPSSTQIVPPFKSMADVTPGDFGTMNPRPS
ncbi:MAG: hypothetical protein LBE86_09940 [Gemmobacter sp.]|nr:hypothetical protein [Gemmobacter sp.]